MSFRRAAPVTCQKRQHLFGEHEGTHRLHHRRVGTLVVALVISAAGLLPLGVTSVTSATTTETYGLAQPATFNANVDTAGHVDQFTSISCSAPGDCTAAGTFMGSNGTEAMTQTETNGTWAVAQPALFASNVQNTSPAAVFNAISCSSPGYCTAAGDFYTPAGHYEAMVETSTNYTWGNAQPESFGSVSHSSTPLDDFFAISCASAGNCTAAGHYYNASNDFEAMTETLTNGTLGSIVPASYPANAEGTPANQFNAISCSSPGYCTAAGQYKDASNDYEAMIDTETNNSWGTIQKATFATGIHGTLPLDEFSAISCWSAGDCTAAGEFQNAGAHTEDMTATLSNGTLSNANTANFASGVESTSTPYSGLSSISCVSAGNCTAAGSFTDAGGNDESMTLTESNGTWSNAHPTTFESGVQNSAPHDYLVSVSCSSAGNCTAAGQFKDAGGNNEAMTVTSTNGTWADAVPASFASGVDSSTPDDYFLAVSCSATGDCTAAGYFQNHSNDEQAMSQTLTLVTNTPTTTTNTPTTTTSTPTTTTTSAVASSAPRPVVTIASKTAALKKSSIAVLVQCASATCGGVAQLFSTKILKKTTIVIRKGKRTLKTVSTKVKVILAQNSYSVASGKSLSLSLKVLKSGLVFLSTVSAKKPVYETITVTVSGGTAATELFKVT